MEVKARIAKLHHPLRHRRVFIVKPSIEVGEQIRLLDEHEGIHAVVVPACQWSAVVRRQQRKPRVRNVFLHGMAAVRSNVFRGLVGVSAGSPVDAVEEISLADRSEVGGTENHQERRAVVRVFAIVPRIARNEGEAERKRGNDESSAGIVE